MLVGATHTPVGRLVSCLTAMLTCVPAPASAQDASPVPQTRADAIALERQEKVAVLWPERQNAMVNLVNGFIDRGLREGLSSGQGANGLQVVLGGMRAAQGLSAGFGYRRSDFLRDQLSFRVTARGTPQGAYMGDIDLGLRSSRAKRLSVNWYTRYEHSPRIAYYGAGNQSVPTARTSYRYDDFASDVNGALEPFRLLHVGVTAGYLHPVTASSGEDGVVPLAERFAPGEATGFGEQTDYTRLGAFAYLDSRDSQAGPRRGTLLGARYREYWDVDLKRFAFRQSEFEFQHYLPYAGAGRVLAIHANATLSFPKLDDVVPFYLQPTLGGNDDLRGFQPYRFRDYHALSLGLEHRWHAFSLLEMAAFVDAGKVVPLKRHLTPTHLHLSGGFGLRFRMQSAVLTRIDLAASDEGFRVMWTFSDIFRTPF